MIFGSPSEGSDDESGVGAPVAAPGSERCLSPDKAFEKGLSYESFDLDKHGGMQGDQRNVTPRPSLTAQWSPPQRLLELAGIPRQSTSAAPIFPLI
jgi:hypothetical protein